MMVVFVWVKEKHRKCIGIPMPYFRTQGAGAGWMMMVFKSARRNYERCIGMPKPDFRIPWGEE